VQVKTFFGNRTVKRALLHLIFWCLFFLFYFQIRISYPTTPGDTGRIAIIYFYKLALQAASAYFLIYFLAPRTLNHNKYALFGLGVAVCAYLIYFLYHLARITIFEVRFPHLYNAPGEIQVPLAKRMTNFISILDFTIWAFTPAAVMGLIRFYENQRMLAQLREEKKSMELKLLRSQLNPHFLFNTLNNLYTLTLRKDDKAPEAISRLSGILDYMLYGPAEPLVSIEKEVELLENYIALEMLRYGDKRCSVTFKKELRVPLRIPPLILLTLVENSFKHGVVKEAGRAEISLDLKSQEGSLWFHIENTIPPTGEKNGEGKRIGLLNIRSQLDLLYPARYSLEISQHAERFAVTLEIHEV